MGLQILFSNLKVLLLYLNTLKLIHNFIRDIYMGFINIFQLKGDLFKKIATA